MKIEILGYASDKCEVYLPSTAMKRHQHMELIGFMNFPVDQEIGNIFLHADALLCYTLGAPFAQAFGSGYRGEKLGKPKESPYRLYAKSVQRKFDAVIRRCHQEGLEAGRKARGEDIKPKPQARKRRLRIADPQSSKVG